MDCPDLQQVLDELAALTAALGDVRVDIANLREGVAAMQGMVKAWDTGLHVMTALGVLGRIAKWTTTVIGAAALLWLAFKAMVKGSL